jgi:hypothetical protein
MLMLPLLTGGLSWGADPDPCTRLLQNYSGPETPFPPTLEKWLEWETSRAFEAFEPEFKVSPVKLSLVPLKEVDVKRSARLPSELESTFLRGDQVLWPKHPYNTVEITPFFKAPELPEKIRAWHTTSRSMVTTIDGKVYGLKMPTNHPFGPNRVEQINKAFPKESMLSSMRRTEIIERIDARLGPDPDLILLKDIFTVTDKITGHGFSIRDLRPLNDGHYYFPAQMLPTVGYDLAQKNGLSFGDFVKNFWARPLGKLQAKLLFRYGIEYNPINPQNFLIQLDRNLKPTGKLACRDLGDSFQVESISKALGLGSEVEKDRALGLNVFAKANPSKKGEYLAWGFNVVSPELIITVTRQGWMDAHDDAFIEELEKLLGVKVPQGHGAYAIDIWLSKPENQAAMLKFQQR